MEFVRQRQKEEKRHRHSETRENGINSFKLIVSFSLFLFSEQLETSWNQTWTQFNFYSLWRIRPVSWFCSGSLSSWFRFRQRSWSGIIQKMFKHNLLIYAEPEPQTDSGCGDAAVKVWVQCFGNFCFHFWPKLEKPWIKQFDVKNQCFWRCRRLTIKILHLVDMSTFRPFCDRCFLGSNMFLESFWKKKFTFVKTEKMFWKWGHF